MGAYKPATVQGSPKSLCETAMLKRGLVVAVCLCFLLIFHLYDSFYGFEKIEKGDSERPDEEMQVFAQPKYGGKMLTLEDNTPYEVIPPEHLFGNKVVMTSVICDRTGSCNATGLARRDINYRTKIANACFMVDGKQVESKTTAIKYVKHKKKEVRVYAVNTFFRVNFGDISVEEQQLSDHIKFRADCNLNETNVPVLVRSVRNYNNKVVLLVTQYYSEVSLHWMELWLNHYFDVGVDIVALYAGFRTDKHQKYSDKLHKLIENDRFKDRVHFFKWDSISAMQTWAHSQASMINHGASFFRGSVIVGADLDELVIPRIKPNLKDVAKIYDNRYGSWALQFQTYIIEANHHTKEKIDREIEKGTLNFDEWIKDAHECGGNPKMPWQCRAKTIFHSLDMQHQGIHKIQLEACNYTEAWLDTKVAVMLHLRGIQHNAWPKQE